MTGAPMTKSEAKKTWQFVELHGCWWAEKERVRVSVGDVGGRALHSRAALRCGKGPATMRERSPS
jgi:hypothetical protein